LPAHGLCGRLGSFLSLYHLPEGPDKATTTRPTAARGGYFDSTHIAAYIDLVDCVDIAVRGMSAVEGVTFG
jgi:hypothetical protein